MPCTRLRTQPIGGFTGAILNDHQGHPRGYLAIKVPKEEWTSYRGTSHPRGSLLEFQQLQSTYPRAFSSLPASLYMRSGQTKYRRCTGGSLYYVLYPLKQIPQLKITIQWNTSDDLDLFLTHPNGKITSYINPNNGLRDVRVRGNLNRPAVENITINFPARGVYQIVVNVFSYSAGVSTSPSVPFNLTVQYSDLNILKTMGSVSGAVSLNTINAITFNTSIAIK